MSKKQRVVNIVTDALLATAGLRGGQILEASSSTSSASHSLLLSASASPQVSHIGGLSEPSDGRREQGDKVVYILMGLTAGNAAGYWGGVINTGVEDILVLPAVTVVSFSLVLHFVTDSRMFWVFGSLFLRRCGVSCASCCGSGNLWSTNLF